MAFDPEQAFVTVETAGVELHEVVSGADDGQRLVALLLTGWLGTTERRLALQVAFKAEHARVLHTALGDLLDRNGL